MSPYLKLLPMLAGIGSPGTIQEVTPCHMMLIASQQCCSSSVTVTQCLMSACSAGTFQEVTCHSIMLMASAVLFQSLVI